MEKIRRKTSVVSVITKGIQTRNAKAPVGFASKLDIEKKITQTKEATEEQLQAETRVETNPIQSKETSLSQEETLLILEKNKGKIK